MTLIALSISTRGLKADLAYERGDVDPESNLICRFTFGNSSASAVALRASMCEGAESPFVTQWLPARDGFDSSKSQILATTFNIEKPDV